MHLAEADVGGDVIGPQLEHPGIAGGGLGQVTVALLDEAEEVGPAHLPRLELGGVGERRDGRLGEAVEEVERAQLTHRVAHLVRRHFLLAELVDRLAHAFELRLDVGVHPLEIRFRHRLQGDLLGRGRGRRKVGGGRDPCGDQQAGDQQGGHPAGEARSTRSVREGGFGSHQGSGGCGWFAGGGVWPLGGTRPGPVVSARGSAVAGREARRWWEARGLPSATRPPPCSMRW